MKMRQILLQNVTLFYYKMRQKFTTKYNKALLQIPTVLLQIATVITKCVGTPVKTNKILVSYVSQNNSVRGEKPINTFAKKLHSTCLTGL